MQSVIKLEHIWLCTKDFCEHEAIPKDIKVLVLTDAFMIAGDEQYPNTQEGTVQAFCAWADGGFVWVPSRKEFFIYETKDYDPKLQTWGGVWHSEERFYWLQETFDEEIYKGASLLEQKYFELPKEEQQILNGFLARIHKKQITISNMDHKNFKKYVRKYSTEEIDFDNPFHNGKLINCQNGVFDLETMQFRSSRREDFLSYILPVTYDPAAETDTLWPFLDTIFCQNVERLEMTLGLLSTALDRTLLPKPILLFYNPTHSFSGRNIFFSFLKNCLGPFTSIMYGSLVDENHPYLENHTYNMSDKECVLPRIVAINEDFFPSNRGWEEIAYMGSGEDVSFHSYGKPLVSGPADILTILKTDNLPKLKAPALDNLYVIPFEWSALGKPALFTSEAKFYTDTLKSRVLNLLIESYQQWIEGKIEIPYEYRQLAKRCFEEGDQT